MKKRSIISVYEIGNPNAKGIVISYNKHTTFRVIQNKYLGTGRPGEQLIFMANQTELDMDSLVSDLPMITQIYYSYFAKPLENVGEKTKCKKLLCDAFGLPRTTKITRKDYMKWAIQNHPDKGGDTIIFQEIQNCWDLYADDVKADKMTAC
jgi:GH43 family beta-xylosidase